MNRLISIKEVSSQTGICRTLIYAFIKSGNFPQPIKVGRSTRFSEAEVQRWIESQIAHRFKEPEQQQVQS